MVASIRIISPAGVLTLQPCMLGISSGLSHQGSVMVISTGIVNKLNRIPTVALKFSLIQFNYGFNIYSREHSGASESIELAFWNNLYKLLEDSGSSYQASKVSLYHDKVIKLLIENKSRGKEIPYEELVSLQREIENISFGFDEDSLFKSVPLLIRRLIGTDKMTAKLYLTEMCNLSEKDLIYIEKFGNYTLEAIMIYVLGAVFNCVQSLPLVRASTLIQQLESAVQVQAFHLGMPNHTKNNKRETKRKVTRSSYAIGASLVKLLVERQLITLDTTLCYTDDFPVSNSKGRFIPPKCFAMCNFDPTILPIKFNLPMVCEPLLWNSKVAKPLTLEDIEGGYLSGLSGDIYNRFRIFSSKSLTHFYIILHHPQQMCETLNRMQSQCFKINSHVLEFIRSNRDTLEEVGLLVRRGLARVNLQEASNLLRVSYYNNDEGIKAVISFEKLMMEFFKRVQRARYEDFVLTLAHAYEGYKFYLPAFMDFRGRVYRAGVLHFHERDLARSLIVFASEGEASLRTRVASASAEEEEQLRTRVASAAAFKFQKFSSIDQAISWCSKHRKALIESSDKMFIDFAHSASDPFQFIALSLCNRKVGALESFRDWYGVPVTQDASASAYQIMSYLLLNQEMARLTNLIPSPSRDIQDLYVYLREELRFFFWTNRKDLDLHSDKFAIVESRLTRKLVKQLFMPLIYGKSVITMAGDIRECFGSLLNMRESYNIARLCRDFWVEKYPDIVNLMRLINLIGWFCAFSDKPVKYSIPLFTTVQDYMRSEPVQIMVYDRQLNNKRRVTLRVPTHDRDKRKTLLATCVNFIHQKDAFIAMKVVERLSHINALVYTVHDNFITTPDSAAEVSPIYTKVFMEMDPPLRIINLFIMQNLVNESLRLCNDWGEEPIPEKVLRELLIAMVPEDKLGAKWEKRVDETIECYEAYVLTVGGMHHAEKWNDFHSYLKSWEYLEYNYSVHG